MADLIISGRSPSGPDGQDRLHLPIRALHEIREFSRPLTRPDWRTCKSQEADVLWGFLGCINEQDRLDKWEVEPEWTLYGKIWYLSTDANLDAHRVPYAPPPPFEVYDREYEKFEFPCQLYRYRTDFDRIWRWYQYRAQWIHG